MLTQKQKELRGIAKLTASFLGMYRMGGIVYDLRGLANAKVSFRRDIWDFRSHPKKYTTWIPDHFAVRS